MSKYSILLKNGKIINVNATDVRWCETSRTIELINKTTIGRINMDNIVGWINADYKVESECE